MPTPSWTEPARWQQLVAGSDCPLCNRGDKPGVVADLRACYVVVDETVPIRGYCCLILKRHAVELHQLHPGEATDFIVDVQRAAAAVQRAAGAIKINYEIHGNVVPHVHMHLVPRYPLDVIETTGLPWSATNIPAYRAGEFANYVSELKELLA